MANIWSIFDDAHNSAARPSINSLLATLCVIIARKTKATIALIKNAWAIILHGCSSKESTKRMNNITMLAKLAKSFHK